MKTNVSQKIKTGAFVIVGITILLAILFLIGRQRNLFSDSLHLFIDYKNVAGLQEGNYVRFGGINVGTVESIDIRNDTTIRVNIAIKRKLSKFIKSDSRANISSDGLMGDKLIQISPGSDSAKNIQENGSLIGVNPFNVERVIARVEKIGIKVENIVGNIDTLSGHLADIFGRINSGQGTFGKLLRSDRLSNQIEQTISSANKTVETIDKAAAGVKENMEAAKHNFLLRGYFRKKEKKRIQDSIKKARAAADSIKKREQ